MLYQRRDRHPEHPDTQSATVLCALQSVLHEQDSIMRLRQWWDTIMSYIESLLDHLTEV